MQLALLAVTVGCGAPAAPTWRPQLMLNVRQHVGLALEKGKQVRVVHSSLLACVVFFLTMAEASGQDMELLVNSGFDDGPGTPWIEFRGSTGYELLVSSAVVPISAHSGDYLVWLGGVNDDVQAIHQDIIVPSNSIGLGLTGFIWITTEESFGIYDNFSIKLHTTAGDLLETLYSRTNENYTTAWMQFSAMSASAYAGDTIRLVMDANCDVGLITNFFLDTISLVAFLDGAALIDSIVDVHDDQGGWILAHFTRSGRDFPDEATLPISNYGLWRRVDGAALAAALETQASSVLEENAADDAPDLGGMPVITYQGSMYIQSQPDLAASSFPPGTWVWVATVPAVQQNTYIATLPTAADSSASGTNYTVFVITAHTTTPSIWYVSEPDSGYSVDNIAPGVPLGLAVAYNTGSGNDLSWDPSAEADFQYYRIYRGDSETFIPGPGNLVAQTATPEWTDPEYDGWDVHYKITALDYAGNESDAGSPTSTTGEDVPSVPNAFTLYQNVPNPFNPVTTIRFDLPQAAHVKLSVFNGKGELVSTIADRQMSEGRKEFVWTAVDGRGRAVSSGIYFYRLVAGEFVQTKKMVLLR